MLLVDEPLLERVDLVVAAGPDRLRDQVVDADDEHVLVVGAVENGHFSLGRRGPVNPPQEVVCQFLGGRLLEPHHTTALGIHRTQEVVNRPVLARRVHPLQADQEGAPSVGIEQFLQRSQFLLVLLNLLGRFLVALVVVLEPRIDVLELDFAARQLLGTD